MESYLVCFYCWWSLEIENFEVICGVVCLVGDINKIDEGVKVDEMMNWCVIYDGVEGIGKFYSCLFLFSFKLYIILLW